VGIAVQIDGNLMKEFIGRYGVSLGSSLLIFYENWRQFGEDVAKADVPRATFYRYRAQLYKDGYLTDDDIFTKRHRWIRVERISDGE